MGKWDGTIREAYRQCGCRLGDSWWFPKSSRPRTGTSSPPDRRVPPLAAATPRSALLVPASLARKGRALSGKVPQPVESHWLPSASIYGHSQGQRKNQSLPFRPSNPFTTQVLHTATRPQVARGHCTLSPVWNSSAPSMPRALPVSNRMATC